MFLGAASSRMSGSSAALHSRRRPPARVFTTTLAPVAAAPKDAEDSMTEHLYIDEETIRADHKPMEAGLPNRLLKAFEVAE
jgi:hypothetical protein